MKRLRVAVLDDHAIVRHGLVSCLGAEADLDIVGVYATSRELLAGLRATPIDVLLLDYSLSADELDGASLIRAVRVKAPECRILILSTHHDPGTVALALRVGARGFVGKGADMTELVKAIRSVATGVIYLNTDMSYRIADTSTSYDPEAGTDILSGAGLSAREREVIRCYLDGMTITEIAQKFNRSLKTISTQKTAAFRKLGVTSNNELFKIKHTAQSS
ncbi:MULTISPECIES: response regulator transcription factor [Paraburkholderia]|uniref:Two component transcriptional regulator, LuxR family n=1 Tax=Paraburkholderia megapolitana TaxID=420953 RepID=A0A1I3E6G5_9BURK|nr:MULTISPECIES: response regulator transcription factor [Paraburkholderia]MCX4162334.1 response regulator transcription factor [Paraburkholderia megapolitana]MDN7157829.1 response regulator transcription factor [Paraburkholderia sp. CHISQ3]MDQ6494876.1 response regulator transcription factor [Paraburkholderia megapolitana]QDQ79944.1 response regulator transcription factor [Paraburkholderia megapolitana]SFH94587.1 two component transcriptional regulator, LuxR family [Paraburkholderia megapolit